ncbi:MAG TPA: 23S rRNA (adenine(2030)-N(6))-methyltransferase RlmJ [Gammaproteobacteria bacterium]
MNYRHAFHAGNFADVVKHTLLILLLEALGKKPAPWAYLDTHAGAGAFDLASEAAKRTGEAAGGIGRLWPARGTLPAAAERLCALVAELNPGAGAAGLPRVYPGSPRVAASLARPGDRLLLAELHPEEAYLLRGEFMGNKAVAVHERDGYEMLQALTPPKERRGLVLMDPPYEKPDEFSQAAAALEAAHARWATGTYALWYPIKDDSAKRRFLRRVEQSGLRKVLLAELSLPVQADALYGTGMLVVNPPWQFDTAAREHLQALAPLLGADHTEVRWLVPE